MEVKQGFDRTLAQIQVAGPSRFRVSTRALARRQARNHEVIIATVN